MTVASIRRPHVAGEAMPAYQAYQILHFAFTVAPIIAGADKFFHVLTNWDKYLAPQIGLMLPISDHMFMLIVGAIEIMAGLLVAFLPRIGAYVVAGWLAAIIVNLLILGSYFDIAVRDFGLCLGALALARLAADHEKVDV